MPELKDVTDPYLPEPKGISSALANTVYLADGSGSGDWVDIEALGSNLKIITSVSDLPTAVGGVITLEADTHYKFSGLVDISPNVLDVVSSTTIISGGSNILDGIVTDSTNKIINNSSYSDVRIKDLKLSAPNGGLFNFTGLATYGSTLLLERVRSDSYVTIGNIDSIGNCAFIYCVFVGGSGEAVFTGDISGSVLGVSNTFFYGYSSSAINLGTTTIGTVLIENTIFNGLVGSVGIEGTTSSGNITTTGKILNCSFTGTTTPITGIDVEKDLKWIVQNNYGISYSKSNASFYFSGNTAQTVISTSTSDGSGAVKVNANSLATPNIENKFSVDASGKVTYHGLHTEDHVLQFNVYNDVVSGTNEVLNFYVAKNGSVALGSRSTRSFDSSDPGSLTISLLSDMTTGDYFELYVENQTSTNNTIVIGCSFLVV